MANGILVVCEPRIKSYSDLNLQLLGKALSLLAENKADVITLYTGSDSNAYFNKICKYGGDRFIATVVSVESSYKELSEVVISVIKKVNPQLVLFPGTRLCKMAAASVSTVTGCGLTAECIDVRSEKNGYVFVRSALGSSVIAEIMCINCNMAMCTVKMQILG
jgi:electron transfer flavoprotein alpha subunit